MTGKRILVVTQHFYPENFRINEYCLAVLWKTAMKWTFFAVSRITLKGVVSGVYRKRSLRGNFRKGKCVSSERDTSKG